jgi:hypothetical protein
MEKPVQHRLIAGICNLAVKPVLTEERGSSVAHLTLPFDIANSWRCAFHLNNRHRFDRGRTSGI